MTLPAEYDPGGVIVRELVVPRKVYSLSASPAKGSHDPGTFDEHRIVVLSGPSHS
jgi:hypothetical protein